MILKVTSGGGITSCLSTRLHDFCNHPSPTEITEIDSSKQFRFYEDFLKSTKGIKIENIAGKIFQPFKPEHFHNTGFVKFNHGWQYGWYNEIKLEILCGLASSVIKLVPEICNRAIVLEEKYDVKNRCGVLYRGNDKIKEIPHTPYEYMVEMALDTGCSKFYVQTDDQDFLDYFKKRFPDTVYNHKLPRIKSNPNSYVVSDNIVDFIQEFLASLTATSSCGEGLITTTGNTGLWSVIFRGTCNKVWQYHGAKKEWRKLF